MIRGVIFDMDGVLVNTEPLHYRVWKQVFAERGVEIAYDVYKPCIGSTADYMYDLLDRAYHTHFRGTTELSARFKEIKQAILTREGIQPIGGVTALLKKLREEGYPLAVASSSSQELIEWVMKRAGLDRYFDLMYSAERVKNPKPAPDVFLEAAGRMKRTPEECLVIEDSANGTRAAKAAGMTCFAFYNPDSGEQDLSCADEVFSTFEEIEGALRGYKTAPSHS